MPLYYLRLVIIKACLGLIDFQPQEEPIKEGYLFHRIAYLLIGLEGKKREGL
jgi:hypothetical protein